LLVQIHSHVWIAWLQLNQRWLWRNPQQNQFGLRWVEQMPEVGQHLQAKCGTVNGD
jgi:hypothetical protein